MHMDRIGSASCSPTVHEASIGHIAWFQGLPLRVTAPHLHTRRVNVWKASAKTIDFCPNLEYTVFVPEE